MTTDPVWRFPFNRSLRPMIDHRALRALPMQALSPLERGWLLEQLVITSLNQCAEATAFHRYSADLITALGPHPTPDLIRAVKLRMVDRYVCSMAMLPPSHYVHVNSYAYPYHPCIQDVFFTVYDQLAILALTAQKPIDFDGVLLGYTDRPSEPRP